MGHGLWVGPWVFFRFNVSKYTLYLANLGMVYDPWVMVFTHPNKLLQQMLNYYIFVFKWLYVIAFQK